MMMDTLLVTAGTLYQNVVSSNIIQVAGGAKVPKACPGRGGNNFQIIAWLGKIFERTLIEDRKIYKNIDSEL